MPPFHQDSEGQKNVNRPVDGGKNWRVFDFCNNFLQTEQALEDGIKVIFQNNN